MLVVISGPSGVGKDTVMRAALERDPRLTRSITMTTRAPREGEQDGVHYDFVTPEAFERHVEAGDLLEHATVHGQRYGSPRSRVREALGTDHDVLLQVDVQGSLALRDVLTGASFVFIAPDGSSDLERRLRERGTDEVTIATRNADRASELAAASSFEHVIVNHEGAPDGAVHALLEQLDRERARPDRRAIEV